MLCFLLVLRNHHSLACGQTVIFEYGRVCVARTYVLNSLFVIRKSAISVCRHVVANHQFFGKLLARLNLCSGLGVSEHRYAGCAESICHARCQSGLRTNHTQIYLLLTCERKQFFHFRVTYGYAFCQLSDTRIARSAIDMLHLRTAAQLIYDGVFTSAGSYD